MQSNWEYRQYLQKNGIDMMKLNSMKAINMSGLNPYKTEYIEKSPRFFKSIHDDRHYEGSDLKGKYINDLRLKSRMISPSINPRLFH